MRDGARSIGLRSSSRSSGNSLLMLVVAMITSTTAFGNQRRCAPVAQEARSAVQCTADQRAVPLCGPHQLVDVPDARCFALAEVPEYAGPEGDPLIQGEQGRLVPSAQQSEARDHPVPKQHVEGWSIQGDDGGSP